MRHSHRYLLAAIVVAVILVSVIAAPTLARTTLAEAQAQASGTGGSAHGDLGDDSAAIMADESNMTNTTMTATPTATVTTTSTSGQGSSGQEDGMTASGHQFVPYTGTPYAVPGKIEAENYDRGLCQEGTSGQGGSGTGPTPTATVTPTATTTSGQGGSGQGTGNATNMTSLTILEPTGTAMVSGPDVTVMVKVTNFSVVDKQGAANVAGEGHIHFYMDVSPIPNTPGEPAIPTNTSAAWAHVSGTSHTFMNVTPGMHTFTVQLVNNDHTPYIPITEQSVMVEVGEAGNTTNMTTATTTATTATTTSSSSSYSAAGAIVMAANGGSQPGAEPGKYTCAQGFAYFDRSPGNQGGAYRQDDVDIEAGGTGHVVAFVKSSEWLIYSIHVPENGMYRASFHASSPWNDREIWVWVDGILEAKVKVKNTGSFDTYEDVSADIALPVGNHYIRLEFVSDAQNLDYFTLERVGSIPTWPFFGEAGTVTPTPTSTQGGGGANVTPTATVTPTPTSTQGGGGANVTPTPTVNVTVTPTPTSTQGGGGANVTPTPTVNVTPTATVNVTVTPTPTSTQGGGGANATDLTNQNSPEAAMFVGNTSMTTLAGSTVSVGLQRVAGNFTSPLFVADAKDGSGRLFVVDQTGYVKIVYTNGTVIDQPFLDVRDRMVPLLPGYDERGLLSIAFHPNFSTNGKIYAYYSAPLRAGADPAWNCTNHLSEFTVSNTSPDMVETASERVLLEVDKPQMNHNGGILLFGPDDGYLYLTLGDGGRADDTGIGHTPGIGNAQDLTKILGKVIRIDVDTVNGPQWNTTANATWVSGAGTLYGIPADNPFLSNSSIPPEVYAYGFRNPAFASFDSGGSNRMFIAMAGQNLFESVLVLFKAGAYPWHIREGTHCFDPANNRTVATTTCRITSYVGDPLIGPIVELGHDIGNVVVGGVVYRGANLTAVEQGSYVFGTWSDSFAVGNGTLLVAMPPAGLDTAMWPDLAASLTPEENAMWTTSEMTVANNADGRIHAFVRGMYESTDKEVLVLINQNPGPGVNPQNSGEVWMMVPANTTGLVPIGNATAPTPTATTVPTTTATTTTTTAPSLNSTVDLVAQNLAFNLGTISVQAGAQVTVNFNNMDSGVLHNFALYTDSSATTNIFRGATVTGPTTTTYTFTAPSTPGSYFFRCDVHPTQMTGTFVVT